MPINAAGCVALQFNRAQSQRIANDRYRTEAHRGHRHYSAFSLKALDYVAFLFGKHVGGNLCRTTGDILDAWDSMSRIGFGQSDLAELAKPGYWNVPDMLEIGNGGMDEIEYKTHISRRNTFDAHRFGVRIANCNLVHGKHRGLVKLSQSHASSPTTNC